MRHDRYTYLPLVGGASSPRRDFWLRAALGLMVVFNLALLWDWYFPDYPSPLDDFQMLKPSFAISTPIHNTSVDARAVVTTLYNDLYATPVATLGHSLQTTRTTARRIVLYIPGRLSLRAVCIVRAAGWEMHPVDFVEPPHGGAGIHYRFVDQYTKLRLWALDALGIERVVYVDADALALRNFDELFELPFAFGAVPDVYGNSGFRLDFNAGVLALRTGTATFEHMLERLEDARFPPGSAEQAFLNAYFGADTVRLPYVYNANFAIKERSPALWDALRGEMRIVHFTVPKPFPKDGSGIIEGAELERAVRKAERDRGGRFVEEIGWWVDAHKDFIATNRDALGKCGLLI